MDGLGGRGGTGMWVTKNLKNSTFMGNGVQNFYKWGILGTFLTKFGH